jgi:hypothetical protein
VSSLVIDNNAITRLTVLANDCLYYRFITISSEKAIDMLEFLILESSSSSFS